MGKKVQLTYEEKDGSITVLGSASVSDDGSSYTFELATEPPDLSRPESGYERPGMDMGR